MSYDVHIAVKVEGVDAYAVLYDLGNITWNVRELIKQSSGWEIKNEDQNGALLPWIEMIQRGSQELRYHPQRYKHLESPNGWGTVGGTLGFYETCLEGAKAWIEENEELLSAAVIYVD